MSELTKEKIYKKELEKVGGEGNNNLERIRSLAGGGSEAQQLYRAGLVFKNKNTGEKYIIVCTLSENVEDFDWGDPNIFNKYCEQVRYGDLVMKETNGKEEEIGIVTAIQANSITIRMLSNDVLDTVVTINSTDFEQWDSYYNTPYYTPSNE